ncbi:MAG: ferric reductase-like transmembrane domain-containing protein [Bacteroidota bacterium]
MRTIKQEHYFSFIIVILLVLWFIDLLLYKGSYEYNNMHIAGEIFSSWAVTVFAVNFLMATRAKWIERMFGGLDKMYMIHRRSGMIAFVLLILHFVVVPRDEVFTIGKPLGFYALVLIFIGIILSAVPYFKRIIKYNSWLNFHKLMGVFYIVGIAHALNVPSLTNELPIVRTYVFGLAFLGIFAWFYKIFFYGLTNKMLNYTIETIKRFDDDISEITLVPKNKTLDFKAGQFAFVSFEGMSKKEAHPFTISNNSSDNKLRFTIKALGDYTANLQTILTEGTKAKVRGPYGEFNFKKATYKKQLWLAGGIGITPFLSFLKEVDSSYDVTMVWSVKTKGEANYQDEIVSETKQNDNINYILNDSSTDGYFTVDKLYKSVDLAEHSIFICGPEVMRESYIEQLLQKGVSIRDIHYEEFSFR